MGLQRLAKAVAEQPRGGSTTPTSPLPLAQLKSRGEQSFFVGPHDAQLPAHLPAHLLKGHKAGFMGTGPHNACWKRLHSCGMGVTASHALLAIMPCACSDMARFGRICKLVAFKPFASAADALEQINAVSESVLSDELKNFLETNLPKVSDQLTFTGSLSVSVFAPLSLSAAEHSHQHEPQRYMQHLPHITFEEANARLSHLAFHIYPWHQLSLTQLWPPITPNRVFRVILVFFFFSGSVSAVLLLQWWQWMLHA